MSIHPNDNTLRLFASGQLHNELKSQIEVHLAQCSACLERLTNLGHDETDSLIQEMKVTRLTDDQNDKMSVKNRGFFKKAANFFGVNDVKMKCGNPYDNPEFTWEYWDYWDSDSF